MANYVKASDTDVAWHSTKWDDCVLVATGEKYLHRAGSGRATVLNQFAADGRTVGEFTKLAAEEGFDPTYALGSVFKQLTSPTCAWTLRAPEGQTIDSIKAIPYDRTDPEAEARRAAKVVTRNARKAENMTAKIAKAEADEIERRKKKAEALDVRAALKAEKAAKAPPKVWKSRVKDLGDESKARPGKLTVAAKRTKKPVEANADVEF